MTRFAFVDVETYYSREYSLKKMTPAEYVLNHQFECIGWSVALDDYPPLWMEVREFQQWLRELKGKVAFVSHNAAFDMFVLAQRFGYVPHLMIDTLGMARATIYSETGSASLAKCAERLNLGTKGDIIFKVEGLNRSGIIANGWYPAYKEYALNDVDLCRKIFRRLMAEGFPPSELLVMDEVLRACICPQLQLNQDLLYTHLQFTEAAKQGLLERAGLGSRETLMSNEMFAGALRGMGVEPPMKQSPTPGRGKIYAFAKTDPGMQDLMEHPDKDVQALVAARLGIKTTIEETRTKRLIDLSNLTYPGNPGKWMPVPLKYSGAHTHRLSGDWKINTQNFRRNGLLRKSIVAPKGHAIVVADASQIEARMTAWFCKQQDLVDQFANGEDVYCSFASEIYKRPITKADKAERFLGKTSILGLGYGMGGTKFELTVRSQAKLNQIDIDIDPMMAADVVTAYREKYSKIPDTWGLMNGMITHMANIKPEAPPVRIYPGSPANFTKGTITGPNGLKLYYQNLRKDAEGEWQFTYGKEVKKIFGGKLLENIIQFLARIVIMDAAIRVRRETGRHFALQAHDELAYVVGEPEAQEFCDYLVGQLCVRPEWGPDIPLAAEGNVGETYGDAK